MILKMWSKDSSKIKILQQELNGLYGQDNPPLRVDGIFGHKTRDKVKKFQQSTGKLAVDGIFGPKTLSEYKAKVPDTKLIAGTSITLPTIVITANKPLKTLKFQNEIQQVFVSKGKTAQWDVFVQAFEKGAIPEIDRVLLAIQNAETARVMAVVYLQMKSWQFTSRQVGEVFGQLAKLNDHELGKVFKAIGTPSGSVGRLLASAGAFATKVGLVMTFVKCLIFAKKGNYAAIFGEVYKFAMGKGVPFGAMIDALQTFIELVIPKSRQSDLVFKIFKTLNPVALGGVAVESATACATAAYYWVVVGKGDPGAMIPRLDGLVKRLKTSPAGLFAELGENAGDAAHKLSRMSSTEWQLIISYKWREFKSLFAN